MAAHEPGAQGLAPVDEPAAAKRKLAAVLSADVKGFSRLMEADEEGTLRTLKSYRATIDALIARHDGRIVGTAGDSVLAEFASPVEAVRCAVETQEELARRNADLPREHRLEFRIGINLGDVIVDGGDLYGDGVNIAARLQALADPGGILISGGIYDQIKTKLPFGYDFLGEQKVKNIVEPVRVYRVRLDAAVVSKARDARRHRHWSVAAIAATLLIATAAALWPVLPPLRVVLAPFTGPPARQAAPATARASIAVLPFANQSDSSADDYFSDGISEDLITALSRFSSIGVMSWNAVASYKGQAVAAEQLARDLPVRYVVDGSVRRSGDKIRVTARLSDAEHGTLLWSEHYDKAVDDLFAVQDDITRRVVNTLAVRVNDLEQERASAKPTDNLDAYDYYLRGRQFFRRFTRSENLQAQAMFERAIELDHDYADAYAALAWTYSKAAEMGWGEWPDEALERAHDLAQAALRLDSSNELAHVLLAIIHTYRQQYELALAELDRATAANPSHTGNYAERGWVLLLAGRWDEVIKAVEEALRYDPNPTPNTFNNLALAYYFRERHAEAIVMLEGAIGRHPHHVPLHIALAAAYAAAGRADDAKRAAANVRRLHPFFEVDLYGEAFRDPATRERVREDLRKAGLSDQPAEPAEGKRRLGP
jgi:TolB-like protein/class 3 adenylate cyclase/Tfp pilus assembly protein PilF